MARHAEGGTRGSAGAECSLSRGRPLLLGALLVPVWRDRLWAVSQQEGLLVPYEQKAKALPVPYVRGQGVACAKRARTRRCLCQTCEDKALPVPWQARGPGQACWLNA